MEENCRLDEHDFPYSLGCVNTSMLDEKLVARSRGVRDTFQGMRLVRWGRKTVVRLRGESWMADLVLARGLDSIGIRLVRRGGRK